MMLASQWSVLMEITLILMMKTNVQQTIASVLLVSLSVTLPPPPTSQARTPLPSSTPRLMIHPEQHHAHLPPPLPHPPPIDHTLFLRREHLFIVDIPAAARTLLQLCRDIRE